MAQSKFNSENSKKSKQFGNSIELKSIKGRIFKMIFSVLLSSVFLCFPVHLVSAWGGYETFLVPVVNFEPWDVCNSDDPYNEEEMYGTELPLLNLTLIGAGWENGVDYYFKCLGKSEAVTNHYDPLSTSLFIGFSTIKSDRLSTGRVYGQVFLSTLVDI